MYIEIQFKNKAKEFRGKTYDYEVVGQPPKVGSVIRMLSADGSKAVAYGTRVKVVGVKAESANAIERITFVESSLDEPSLSGS